MNLLGYITLAVSCLMLQQSPIVCIQEQSHGEGAVLGVSSVPEFTGLSIDIELTAQSALAWDVRTSTVLYAHNAEQERPIASISKLLSALTVRKLIPTETIVKIPEQARRAQLLGSNIKLPVGEHATVEDLLSASLVSSANDAIISLAVITRGSEQEFVNTANIYAEELGIMHTKLSNSTGLSGGEQYSTAYDVKTMMELVYKDPVLRPMLSMKKDTLITEEGTRRVFSSTNRLIGTYLPIIAAKTGYTQGSGQCLTLITERDGSKQIGIVIIGSKDRFQDAKVLAEWIWRNYTWPQ